MKYSSGKNAWGRCMRCGDKVRYNELVADGNIPGLRVHPGCRDIKHPTEKPFNATDAVLLKHPSPDIDDDSPGSSGTLLIDAMGWTNTFGGGT